MWIFSNGSESVRTSHYVHAAAGLAWTHTFVSVSVGAGTLQAAVDILLC